MIDSVVIVVMIAGLVGCVGFVVAAVARTRGDRRWDRLFLGSALVIAVSFGTVLAYSWLRR